MKEGVPLRVVVVIVRVDDHTHWQAARPGDGRVERGHPSCTLRVDEEYARVGDEDEDVAVGEAGGDQDVGADALDIEAERWLLGAGETRRKREGDCQGNA